MIGCRGEVYEQSFRPSSFKSSNVVCKGHREVSTIIFMELSHNAHTMIWREIFSEKKTKTFIKSVSESLDARFAVCRHCFLGQNWLKITRITRILWDVKWSWGWHPWDPRDDQWLLSGYGVGGAWPSHSDELQSRWLHDMSGESPREPCGWSCVGRQVAYIDSVQWERKRETPKFSAKGWPLLVCVCVCVGGWVGVWRLLNLLSPQRQTGRVTSGSSPALTASRDALNQLSSRLDRGKSQTYIDKLNRK
jgi:hypothetical protein